MERRRSPGRAGIVEGESQVYVQLSGVCTPQKGWVVEDVCEGRRQDNEGERMKRRRFPILKNVLLLYFSCCESTSCKLQSRLKEQTTSPLLHHSLAYTAKHILWIYHQGHLMPERFRAKAIHLDAQDHIDTHTNIYRYMEPDDTKLYNSLTKSSPLLSLLLSTCINV